MKLGKPYQLYRTSSNCMLLEKLAEADGKEELWQLHNRRQIISMPFFRAGRQ
jgi:hypothetical protein